MNPLRACAAFQPASIRSLAAFLFVAAIYCGPACGLPPDRQVSQYGHTAWRTQDGYFSGTVNAITQTRDGYIWIGTEAGLVRFDGARFVPFRPPAQDTVRPQVITSLLGASDGSLWIGTTTYLARLKDGHVSGYLDHLGQITAIREGHDGGIWISRQRNADQDGALCEVVGTKLRCYGKREGVPFGSAHPLAEGAAGDWWIASPDQLADWKNGSSTLYSPAGLKSARLLDGFTSLALAADGSMWAGVLETGRGLGLQHLVESKWVPFVTTGFDSSRLSVSALMFDGDHSLWVGTTDEGVYRIRGSTVDHFDAAKGLSGDWVNDFFEDREGNIWVGTTKGVDKFRATRVVSFSKSEGLSADFANSLLATGDGTTWVRKPWSA